MKKVLKGIGIIFGILVLSMFIFVWVINSTNKPKGNNEEIMRSKLPSPSKALVVYQPTISDFSSQMAHQIAKGLNDSGYEVTLNYPGDHLPDSFKSYDLVVLGSGTYVGKMSEALTNYISRVKDFSSAKIILFSTGTARETIELEAVEKQFRDTKVYKKIKFYKDNQNNDQVAYDFGRKISKK